LNESEDQASPAQLIPTWFWVVSGLALLWNLAGLGAFFAQTQMTQEDLLNLPVEQQVLFEDVPWWATAAFAAAVFGGTLGCLALLARSKFALVLFVVSILGVVIQNVHSLLMSDAVAAYGNQAIIMPACVFTIGVGLIVMSVFSMSKGWLR